MLQVTNRRDPVNDAFLEIFIVNAICIFHRRIITSLLNTILYNNLRLLIKIKDYSFVLFYRLCVGRTFGVQIPDATANTRMFLTYPSGAQDVFAGVADR